MAMEYSAAKGQIISKELLASSNSPKKRTNEFVFTTTTNLFAHFLGEFEDTKESFRNYLTFNDSITYLGMHKGRNCCKGCNFSQLPNLANCMIFILARFKKPQIISNLQDLG